MRRTLITLGITGLLLATLPALAELAQSRTSSQPVAAGTVAKEEAGPAWYTSWDEAMKESQKTGKPILMDFTGSDWCGWCIKLKEEVFSTAEFKTWAEKNVVLLEVDFPRANPLPEAHAKQNEELAAKYEVQGFPTIVFVDSKGEQLTTLGYEEGGPQNWISMAEAGLAKK